MRAVFRRTFVWSATASVLALVAACKFDPQVAGEGSDGQAMPDGAAVQPDMGVKSRAPCATADATGLVACFEFEDDMTDGMLDDSSAAHRDAATTAMQPDARGGSQAAHVEPTSVTRVPQTTALDLANGYTFTVWVKPDSLPEVGGSVYGILDHESQYAMLISNTATGLQNRCVHTGVARAEYTEHLAVGAWSFLACTWNGTEFCAYRWTAAGDHEHFCHHPTVPPSLVGAQGLAIGHLSDQGTAHSRFDGSLDSLQIYNRPMTEDQLCTQLGQGAGCMPCNTCT